MSLLLFVFLHASSHVVCAVAPTDTEEHASSQASPARTDSNTTQVIYAKRSPVWEYFNTVDGGFVACIRCTAKLAHKDGCTSVMRRHLNACRPGWDQLQRRTSSTSLNKAIVDVYRTGDNKRMDYQLAALFLTEGLPASLISRPGMVSFLGFVRPNYLVPTRWTQQKRSAHVLCILQHAC